MADAAPAQVPLPPVSGPPIEKVVLALPGVENPEPPEHFKSFASDFLLRLRRFFQETSTLIDDYHTHDQKVREYVRVISEKAEDMPKFQAMVQRAARKGEPPDPEAAVNLFGLASARNWVFMHKFWRIFRDSEPELEKTTGNYKVPPNTLFKYAIRAEEFIGGETSANANLAYASGACFDILCALGNEKSTNKKQFLQFVEDTFAHSMRTSRIAKFLAVNLQSLELAKYMFAACVMHDVGKLALAMIHSEYLAIVQKTEKLKAFPREMRFYMEERIFQVNHAQVSASMCHFTRWFEPIQRVALFHHEPFLLQGEKTRGEYDLTSLLSISTNVANNFRRPTDPKDPVIRRWRGPETKDFVLPTATILSTIDYLQSKGA